MENEQHWLLSLLYSRSKESIIVTSAKEKSHKDGVSELLALTGMRCQNNGRRLIMKNGGGGVVTDWAHIRVLSSSRRPSRPSEFSAMGWDRNARNLSSQLAAPRFSFSHFLSRSFHRPRWFLYSLHLTPVLSFYISWKVPPTPTHATYSINKSNRRMRKKEERGNKTDQ